MLRRRAFGTSAILTACIHGLFGPCRVYAQTPPASLTIGLGIDTTHVDVGAIVRLAREYFLRPDTSAITRGLWSTAHPLDRLGDIAGPMAYYGLPATILSVLSAGAGDSLYVVKILHTTRDAAPFALQRLYAVRNSKAPRGWQLSNAFARVSQNWTRRTLGRITFYYQPGLEPNPSRAARGVQFVDSVAKLFDVRPPDRLDYIVAASPDEYARAIGIEYLTLQSPRDGVTGGQISTGQGILFAGDPAQGEAYLHELTHAVLARYIGGGVLLGEGVPVWFGGLRGRSALSLYQLIVEYQDANPQTKLSDIIHGVPQKDARTDEVLRATGALFVEYVYRRSGVAGLRALKGTPAQPSAVLEAMKRHLALASDSTALEQWWRQAARASARVR